LRKQSKNYLLNNLILHFILNKLTNFLSFTSALREKLGLPPLAIEGTSEDIVDSEKDAYDNYQKMKQETDKAAKAEEIRKSIEK